MRRHAVHHRAHGVLADAVVDVPPALVGGGKGAHAALVLRGALQVGRAGEQLRDRVGHQVHDVAGGLDAVLGAPLLRGAAGEGAEPVLPALRQAPFAQPVEFAALLRRQRGDARLPRLVFGQAAPPRLAPGAEHVVGHGEGRVGPAQGLARLVRVAAEHPRAMGRARALDAGDAAADHRAARDHGGPRVAFGEQHGGGHRIDVVAVHLLHVPVAEAEAGRHVVDRGDADRPVVGHQVVVPEEAELAELELPRERDDLVPDPLLQAAVADQRPGAVVHDARSEAALEEGFGDRHAGGVGDALAERAGRGLDAAARVVFGMAFAVRAELAEALDLVEGDLRVAAEVEQRVEEHGAVAVRLHEAVAVEPERVLGVELQVPREQRRGDVGGAERRAGMPFADALDRVHGQEADRIGHQAGIDVRHGSVSLRLAPLPGVWGGVCRAASAGTRPEICAGR